MDGDDLSADVDKSAGGFSFLAFVAPGVDIDFGNDRFSGAFKLFPGVGEASGTSAVVACHLRIAFVCAFQSQNGLFHHSCRGSAGGTKTGPALRIHTDDVLGVPASDAGEVGVGMSRSECVRQILAPVFRRDKDELGAVFDHVFCGTQGGC